MKKLSGLVLALTLAGGIGVLCGFAADAKKEASLMRKKLERSQKVLEGIALNNFAKIEANAEELIAISKEASWRAVKSARYEVYVNEFRRIAETLIGKAKEKNIDGVTLAYMDLTMTCVKCHKHVREVRMTRSSKPSDSESAQDGAD
jgi:hypothetical protein